LAHQLYSHAAIAASICSSDTEMERFTEEIIKNSKNVTEKLRMYEVRIQSYTTRDDPGKAVKLALKVLSDHGVHFPKAAKKLDVLIAFIRIKLFLTKSRVKKIMEGAECDDAYQNALMNIMLRMGTAAYFVAPPLQALSTFKRIQFSYKYGISPAALLAYGAYALILCGVFGKFDEGYKFGLMAEEIFKKLKNDEYKARVSLYLNAFVRVWKEPLKNCPPRLLEGINSGLDYGDIDYVAYQAFNYSSISIFAGLNLEETKRNALQHNNSLEHYKHRYGLEFNSVFLQCIYCLTGDGDNTKLLTGKVCDSEKLIAEFEAKNNKTGLGGTFTIRQYLAYLFGDHEEAYKESVKTNKYREGMRSTFLTAFATYIETLNMVVLSSRGDKKVAKKFHKKIKSNMKLIDKWCDACEDNMLGRKYLVEAEIDAMEGHEDSAVELYDLAIEHAKEQKMLNEEGLANERAAIYLTSIGNTASAVNYFEGALEAYRKWGAKAKVDDIKKVYQSPHQ
jgi:predicted ATPase